MFSLLGQQFIKSDFMKTLIPQYIDKNVNEKVLSIERIKIENNNQNNENQNQNQKPKTKKTKNIFAKTRF